ncbi:MAG: ABC transporter substrate-binding protein [Oscillospiraceae bacterium]|nr:ABC transporter substrate-binding protein [Oscillospiraceae bacterium]
MKKRIRNLVALLLVCLMVVSIASCNKTNDNGNTNNNTNNTTNDNSSNSNSNTDSNSSNSNDSSNTNTNAGDNSSNAGEQVSARDTLNVATSGDSGTLLVSEMMGSFVGIAYQYMEVLVNYDMEGNFIWELATGIDEVSSSLWVIHLREGVTFSNGSKFDAKDVWFTFERYIYSPRGNWFLTCFDLDNSRIVDDYTIEIALSQYSVQQMGSLCQIFIVDAETFDEDDFAMNPVGTGPYVVTEYVMNSHVYMEARDDYWGGKPLIKNIHYRVINEDSQIVNAIEAGTLDIAAIPSQDREYVKSLPGFNVTEYYTVFVPTISFNMDMISVMSNLDARLAVCYAADRQAMINLAYFGYGTVGTYPVSEHCYDYEPRFANLHPTYSVGRDLDLAKQHAEAAGLVGKDIIVITNGSSAYIASAEVLQANLKEIGVNLIINNYDGATYMDASQDPTLFDMTMYAVASPQCLAIGQLYEYILWGSAQYGSGGWAEFGDYIALGAAAVSEPDMAKRSDMLYQLSMMFMDATPWYAIGDMTAAMGINSELGGGEILGSGVMKYNTWYWKS